MPTLTAKSIVKRFMLPSTKDAPEADQAWVDFETGPLVTGDIISIEMGEDTTQTETAVRMLAHRVKAWNYTNEAGEPLPVSFETVQLLDVGDFTYLAEQIPKDVAGLPDTEKKT